MTGTLTSAVEAGDTISNTVDVEWTSLDGDVTDVSPYNDDSDERDGTGGVNDYTTSDSADLTIDIPAINKEFINSNQDFTTDPAVAIGEIITYSITITVPEGVTLNAQLVDTLDEGLAFVDCISVTAAASSGDTLTTSIGGWGDACNDPTNPVITDIGSDPSGEGRVATFDLGTITNSSIDGIDDTITLVYSAVVVNSLGNDRGDTLNNAATLTFDGGSVSDSAPNVVIVEPELVIDKVATPSTGDADDLITFELDIQHTGASNTDAFNAVMVDDIPALLTYETGTLDCTLGTLNPTTCDRGWQHHYCDVGCFPGHRTHNSNSI